LYVYQRVLKWATWNVFLGLPWRWNAEFQPHPGGNSTCTRSQEASWGCWSRRSPVAPVLSRGGLRHKGSLVFAEPSGFYWRRWGVAICECTNAFSTYFPVEHWLKLGGNHNLPIIDYFGYIYRIFKGLRNNKYRKFRYFWYFTGQIPRYVWYFYTWQ
jgi:hypothetical protein